MDETEKRLAYFDRALKTVAAHFARHGKRGTNPSVTRTIECAFETEPAFSHAMAASLMLKAERSANLLAGLESWDVFNQPEWTQSADRHAGQSLAEIRASLTDNAADSCEQPASEPVASRNAGRNLFAQISTANQPIWF